MDIDLKTMVADETAKEMARVAVQLLDDMLVDADPQLVADKINHLPSTQRFKIRSWLVRLSGGIKQPQTQKNPARY